MWRAFQLNSHFCFFRSKSVANVSSIICLSQAISEVRDVPLSVFIDKSPVHTTKVFYYKETPKITAVLPACSFHRLATQRPQPKQPALVSNFIWNVKGRQTVEVVKFQDLTI